MTNNYYFLVEKYYNSQISKLFHKKKKKFQNYVNLNT